MLLFIIAFTLLVRFPSQKCKGNHLNRVTRLLFMKPVGPWSVSSYLFETEDVTVFLFGFGTIKILHCVINNFQLHILS